MRHAYYVVILVVRRTPGSAELLMAKRAPGRYMAGTWQLIAGRIEPGEVAWRAALRELREETGLTPTEFYRLSTLTGFYRPDDDSLNTAPMFCAIVDPSADVAINDEHTAFRWVPAADAAGQLMWPGDRAALDEVRLEVLGDGPARPYLRVELPGGGEGVR